MKRKNIGLLLSVSILLFMAVFSEKKVLVTTGYAVSRPEIDMGRGIYAEYCRHCHGRTQTGAPRVGDAAAWKDRVKQGMDTLIAHAVRGYDGKSGPMPARGGYPELDDEEVAAAVAYMVRESGEKQK